MNTPNVPPLPTDPTNPNPLMRILSSSKALIALVVIAVSFAALFTGKADWTQIESIVKWTLGVWLGSQGIEDAAKHFGAGMAARQGSVTNVSAAASVPPPADTPRP